MFTPEEYGLPQPPPKPIDPAGQPLGNAQFPLPHPALFLGQFNSGNRAYTPWFDEAMLHSRENAERMRLDPIIDACLRLRTYPTALLTMHIDPDDPDDPYQVDCARKAELILNRLPGFTFIKRWLLDDGLFKGRSGAQIRWQWVYKGARQWLIPTAFKPIDGDKITFSWSDNKVGLMVGGSFVGPPEKMGYGNLSRVYWLDQDEREQIIIHQFEPEDRSFFSPIMSGAIHGTGIRGKLYWFWALKSQIWEMGMDYLRWFAKGLLIYYFKNGNVEHFNQLREWVQSQDGNHALFMPWMPNDGGYRVLDVIQPSLSNSQFIQQLVTNYFDDVFKLVILGQTLTSGTASTGLGSGVAAAHQQTFENFVKYDAVALGETLTRDLLTPFYRVNFPGVPVGRWVFEVDDPNVQQLVENARALYEMGAAIPEEPLLEAAGIPKPKTGQTILTNMQGMQPAAVDGLPDGVPVVT